MDFHERDLCAKRILLLAAFLFYLFLYCVCQISKVKNVNKPPLFFVHDTVLWNMHQWQTYDWKGPSVSNRGIPIWESNGLLQWGCFTLDHVQIPFDFYAGYLYVASLKPDYSEVSSRHLIMPRVLSPYSFSITVL